MHPASFYVMSRLELRRVLREQGHGWRRINEIVRAADDDVMDVAWVQAGVSLPVGAFGDGKIIQMILDFLKSEEGQNFIKMLISLIIGFV